jgi:hypothetical protein
VIAQVTPLRIVRTNNSPVWGGWLFVGMGAGVLLLRQLRSDAGTQEQVGLAVVAAIFIAVGAVVVVRAWRQTSTFLAATRQLVIEERTRFSSKRRVLPFDQVERVEVESFTDPDPDARPFEQTSYRLVVRLHEGTRIPITDLVPGQEAVARLRDEVAVRLG